MNVETIEPIKKEVGWQRQAWRGSGAFAPAAVEPWPEPVDGQVLLDELCQVLKRYVVLPKWAAEALALWVLHTYAFHLREVSTYVGLESPEKRCGKTTLLSVLSELVSRPIVAANISSPAFFRVIEEVRPTLLIDEADTFLQGNDELRGILNSGYTRKTAYVVRVASQMRNAECGMRNREGIEQGRELEDGGARGTTRPTLGDSGGRGTAGPTLARFSCWCPKVMAAIGRLPETLADRCIVIRMQRKMVNEQCERLRNLDGNELRRKCARYVADHEGAIAAARPTIPESLNDRAADIWEPLLALADLAGARWPEQAREAAAGISAASQEHNPSAALLFDLMFVFGSVKADRLFSRTIIMRLNMMADRPWAETNRGRAIDENWLAQKIRPYGVRPRTVRIGEQMAKGYVFVELRDVFRRYISQAEVCAGMERLGINTGEDQEDLTGENRGNGEEKATK